MLSRHLFGELTPLGGDVPVSKCSPDLSSIMSIVTYTAERFLSRSCGPPRPAIEKCSLGRALRRAAQAVPHVLLQWCSPGRPCQLAALAVPKSRDLLTGTYASRRRGLPKKMSAEHINLKI
jgi:hypothetical protein